MVGRLGEMGLFFPPTLKVIIDYIQTYSFPNSKLFHTWWRERNMTKTKS